MRFAVPAIAIGLLAAACGGGDSPFDTEDLPSPTVGSVSQTPVPQNTSAASPAGCQPTDYEVQAGDTLLAVATANDVTVDAIVEATELEDPDVLTIGQVLKIPCPPAVTPTPIGTGDEEPTGDDATDDEPTGEGADPDETSEADDGGV